MADVPDEKSQSIPLLRSSLQSAAKRYADYTTLRAAVVAIPYVGSSIDVLLSARASQEAVRRLELLIEYLHRRLEKVNAENVDRAYLESEEWLAAVVRAFEVSGRSSQSEKIRLYAEILAGAATTQLKDCPDPSQLLDVLAELSLEELTLAQIISQQGGSVRFDEMNEPRRVINEQAWKAVLGKVPARLRPNLVFHLKRLERSGLIAEVTGAFYDYAGGMYEPTPTLMRLVRYVEAVTKEQSHGTQ